MRTRTIKIDMLARVEGEGGLSVSLKGGELEDVRLHIFEPPRFFEGFLRGRRFDEAPDITARICGICPIAYQISSATAMEDALGIVVGGQLRELRRLIYCGEWIESHALHIHLLHAPDFLGYDDAIQMAAEFPDEVKRGLRLKKLGNRIMALIGGREIHPVNMKVGGFYSVPAREALLSLRDDLLEALDEAVATAKWVAGLAFPSFETVSNDVALREEGEGGRYPLFGGRICCNRGVALAVSEYETVFEEFHEKHSHALHSRTVDGGVYQVGPIARFNLNRDRLTPVAAATANELNIEAVVANPFRSIVVRAIETVFAIEESLRIIDAYDPPPQPSVEYEVQAGEGFGVSEAPRGICWHRYRIGENGEIEFAKIVPPTSQNQARIEQDLRELIPSLLVLNEEQMKWRCEQAVRNYDPCISCATHFLKLEVHRE
ncbi:MAG TPA: Ni/Fe hydrogenase subunit alpha [Fimbriimonas sp.]